MSKETAELRVDGMSCSHCENAVKKALGKIPGVSSVSVNLDDGTVAVEYDASTADIGQLKAAIAEEGYGVM